MRKIGCLLAIAVTALAATGRAEAAPQILGLLASNGMPTPLHCRDGLCTGLFASFCLQEARVAPADGQDYKIAPGGGLVLSATLADGRHVRLPAGELAIVRVRDGYLSVQISLPEARLEALGVPTKDSSLALEVGPETSILPVEQAGDPDPQTPEEIAEATGPLRRIAAQTFDRPGEDAGAARWLGLLINALPPADDPGPVAMDELVHQVVASTGASGLNAEGLDEAVGITRNCEPFAATSMALGFCLSGQQHGLLGTLNSDFWDDAGGS